MFSIFTVLAVSAFNLSARFMHDCPSMIIQIPYNAFPAVVFSLYVLQQYIFNDVVPFTAITDKRALYILIISCIFNYIGQAVNVIAYQSANPALASLLSYS